MALNLKRFVIADENGKRFGEASFASDNSDEPDEYVIFRSEIRSERHPRLPEAQLEALRVVRNAIGDEIHRLEQIRRQAHPSEDWHD